MSGSNACHMSRMLEGSLTAVPDNHKSNFIGLNKLAFISISSLPDLREHMRNHDENVYNKDKEEGTYVMDKTSRQIKHLTDRRSSVVFVFDRTVG